MIALCGAPAGCVAQPVTPALPALGAASDGVTVSGLSSGAYMAGQFHVAHSARVTGAALIAGGPYGCAEHPATRWMPVWVTGVAQNVTQALSRCMQVALGAPDGVALLANARELAVTARIDPIEHLTDDRVYLFHGADDDVVARAVVRAARAFYGAAGIAAERLRLDERPGAHGMLTESVGGRCDRTAAPYLLDCDYDQAGAIVTQLVPGAAPPAAVAGGELVRFDQRAFAAASSGLAIEGYAYIPATCRERAGCAVHIAFHGCEQSAARVGDAFAAGSGFARWADSNRLIVLYPQVGELAANPKGCWDWWGYAGLDFRTRAAPQIAAVARMLGRLAER